MSTDNGPSWLAGFKADYETIFVEEWSPYLGSILLVMVIIALMINGLFWGVFGGVKFWGDWFNNLIGLGPLLGVPQDLDSFLMHRMSLMNIMLLLGSFCAALLSRQFLPRRPPKLEYIWAALGGCLMGTGAALAGGCTTGGFFNPVLHASPAGWAMWVGLLAGAVIGLKLLLWTLENIEWGMVAPPALQAPQGLLRIYPWIGLAVVIGVLFWATQWYGSGNEKWVARAVIVLAGFAIGFIMHRSRLCFARAFREPFMTAEGDMTKAIILALTVGLLISSLLFQKKVLDPYVAIPAAFWIGSLLGGLIFGIGMIFAGGCASGSLWRMGEGHIKLWVAIFFFSWAGSIASALFKKFKITSIDEDNVELFEKTAVGFQAYLPDMTGGWGWTYLISGAILLLWYLLVRYNESTEKFTVI
ncbi:MAG: YeeE/YedE thiosulfate transporter family protein [Sulfurimicrobium sp.]|nr:YeeE/YedE thiosulfate transporter family protein [Sulfurimicrobium sp.]MDO9189221.1 YeeE/YedE thiosulfate transporter family protein [Sulfurimicrobium sp.]MDP1705003.1 YeeE/YedE thiosulfate transporter family protein [Sulfurimicrobium sp.]MDP1898771.1 YeeE/YedE thiosulfate transporter family protein [Sulfurimicrobium sp.]MDP2196997.1 YeeE/YedE thiosulfate transporter family protein [Sulfurimicrobium sp.]